MHAPSRRAALALVVLSLSFSVGPAYAEDDAVSPVVRPHLVRVDLQTGVPVPHIVPDLAAQLSYTWFPISRVALEAVAAAGIMGEQLGVGARVHYTRRFFVAVRETAIFATGLAHDVFGGATYPGYLLGVDLLGYESRDAQGWVFHISGGLTAIIHDHAKPRFEGFIGPQLAIGWGRCF